MIRLILILIILAILSIVTYKFWKAFKILEEIEETRIRIIEEIFKETQQLKKKGKHGSPEERTAPCSSVEYLDRKKLGVGIEEGEQ